MRTIKWLLGLEKGQLVIAMLMIAITALFTQNQVKENQKDSLNKSFREALIKRDDSCEAQKIKVIQEANRRMEEFMQALLERSRRTERVVDSTMHHNKQVIDKVKSKLQ